MYNTLHRYFIVLFLCLSLLLTMGMYLGAANTEAVIKETAAAPQEELPSAEQQYGVVIPPLVPAKAVVSAVKDETLPAEPQPVVPEPVTAKTGTAYITTAYFLNVRSAPTNKSKILKVVKKDTILQVEGEESNGWLRLEEEGYVHGAYAIPANDSAVAGDPASDVNPEPVPVIPTTMVMSVSGLTDANPELEPEPNPEPESEPATPTSKVMSASGLTEEHIGELLEGTALAGHELEEAILEIEEQYGVNAYFTIAVMKLESGNGKSRLAMRKNNLFGLNASGSNPYQNALVFDSKADCVRKFGQLISEKYVGKGFTTVEKVARKYCPANGKWPSLVKTIMKRDHNLL